MAHILDDFTLSYGDDVSVTPATLPIVSIKALLNRGFSHYCGNEQASKLSSKIDKALELPEDTSKEVRRAKFKEWREANDAQVKAWTAELMSDAVKALVEGTIGDGGTRGPQISPLERHMRALAKKGVLATLAANGIKAPKKAEDKVKTGSGEFTMDQLVDRRLANPNFAPDIEKEAKRMVAAEAKIVNAGKTGGDDL